MIEKFLYKVLFATSFFSLVPGWRDVFKFGAINCAQQNCDKYRIGGTPTLRLFYGGAGSTGIDVMATLDLDQLRTWLLQQLEIAQSYGFMKSEKLPNFLLVS